MGDQNACIAVYCPSDSHREKIHLTGSVPRLDFSLLSRVRFYLPPQSEASNRAQFGFALATRPSLDLTNLERDGEGERQRGL